MIYDWGDPQVYLMCLNSPMDRTNGQQSIVRGSSYQRLILLTVASNDINTAQMKKGGGTEYPG